jgi:hypothetical protein
MITVTMMDQSQLIGNTIIILTLMSQVNGHYIALSLSFFFFFSLSINVPIFFLLLDTQ